MILDFTCHVQCLLQEGLIAKIFIFQTRVFKFSGYNYPPSNNLCNMEILEIWKLLAWIL